MSRVDYSALTGGFNKDQFHNWLINDRALNSIQKYSKRILPFIEVLALFMATPWINGWISFLVALTAVTAGTVAVYFIVIAWYKKSMKLGFMYLQFAEANGLVYKASHSKFTGQEDFFKKLAKTADVNSLLDDHADPGIVFNVGHSKLKSHIFERDEYQFYSYRYTTGSNKSRKDHYWMVGVAKLKRKLPHILLDAKGNNTALLRSSNLPGSFSSDQKIDAGALSEHFDVFVPEGYDIDVLSFITPEVVEKLIQYRRDLDIEIIDDKVYVYYQRKFAPQHISKLLEPLLAIGEEVSDNLGSYRDQRATTVAERSAIAKEGSRLKQSYWGIASLPFAIIGYFIVFNQIGNAYVVTTIAVLAVAVTGLISYNRWKNH